MFFLGGGGSKWPKERTSKMSRYEAMDFLRIKVTDGRSVQVTYISLILLYLTYIYEIYVYNNVILPVPMAERSETRTVFGRSNTWIVGSNPTREMNV
jgi:hypothetical protein